MHISASQIIKPTQNTEWWNEYLDTLSWEAGNRDSSSWNAFLRAAKLSVDKQHAIEVVSLRIKNAGGAVKKTKLISQVNRAYAGKSEGKAVTLIQPPKPTFDPAKLKEFAEKAPGIDAKWLQSRSPVSTEGLNSASFLEHLYRPGEMVLVFTDFHSQGDHLYTVGSQNDPLPKLTADGVWYLVNPVDGQTHPNARQENKPSRRSEESVTSWRYLVLESDVADHAEWLSALVQLPLQISAIYSSGGKSIHALVRVDANSKQQWDTMRDAFRAILVPLGADENAMTGVRLSRLPGAMRGLQLQELFYLNPSPTSDPIKP